MARTKTPREASETQQQLLKATLDVIADKGIEGATARAIADEAGVNQALVFYHFESVTGLVIAAVAEMSARRHRLYTDVLSHVNDMATAVEKLFEVFIADRSSSSFLVLSQFVGAAKNNPDIAQAVEQIFTPWITLTHDTVTRVLSNAGLPYDLTYDDISMGLMSLFMGIQFMAVIPAYEDTMNELIEKIPNLAPIFAMLPLLAGTLTSKK